MEWDMAAALGAVAGALATVAVTFFRFLTKRIDSLEKMVDTFIPALEKNTSAIEKSNAVNEEFLAELRRRRKDG